MLLQQFVLVALSTSKVQECWYTKGLLSLGNWKRWTWTHGIAKYTIIVNFHNAVSVSMSQLNLTSQSLITMQSQPL